MSDKIKDLKADVEETTETMRAVGATARDVLRKAPAAIAHKVADKTSDTAASLRDSATDRLDSARTHLSDAGFRLAGRMRRAAEDESTGAIRTRVLSSAASRVAEASGVVGRRTVSEVAGEIREMAHRNPAPFILGAAVAGFALARLLQPRQQK